MKTERIGSDNIVKPDFSQIAMGENACEIGFGNHAGLGFISVVSQHVDKGVQHGQSCQSQQNKGNAVSQGGMRHIRKTLNCREPEMRTDTEQNNWNQRNTPSVLGVKSGTGKKKNKRNPQSVAAQSISKYPD